jgi:flagellar protein FliO/FliZ
MSLTAIIGTGVAAAATNGTAQKIGYAAPSTPGIGSAIVGLVLVLGLILGMAWLLKRMPGAGRSLRQSEQLRIVGMLSVGTKERVAVIQIGKEQLLVGVSPGGISRLYLLPEPLEVAPAPTLPDFADLLAKRLRKGT